MREAGRIIELGHPKMLAMLSGVGGHTGRYGEFPKIKALYFAHFNTSMSLNLKISTVTNN